MDSTILQQVPDEYKEIYRLHWNIIKPSIKRGMIREMYHYPLITDNVHLEIKKRVQDILRARNKLKINVAFGFILRHRTSDELKFFHPSNNTMLFETPRLVITAKDRRELTDDVEAEDAYEYARQHRPSTSWITARIICGRFDLYNLKN